MRIADVLAMAVHNLRFRPARTALNLVGVVVGCIVLLMTTAGVTGVKDTLRLLFDSSETARQIGVLAGNYPAEEPPPEAIKVEGEMSEKRRLRIEEQLKQEWLDQNRRKEPWTITTETVKELAEIPHVQSVVPDVYLPCSISLAEPSAAPAGREALAAQRIESRMSAADDGSQLLRARILAGGPFSKPTDEKIRSIRAPSAEADSGEPPLQINSDIEVLMDEFLAYRFGYRSDAELEQLVGQEVEIEYQIAAARSTQVFGVLAQQLGDGAAGDSAQQRIFAEAATRLADDLDKTSLSAGEKTLLRSLLRFDQSEQQGPAIVRRRFTICGVIQKGEAASISSLFRAHWFGSGNGLLAHSSLAAEMSIQRSGDDSFYNAVATVDSTEHLTEATTTLKNLGARTLSAERIIRSMNESVDRSAWVVYGIAAAILLTAAIGISNTLLISVLERTPEFGILKSVGARRGTLLWLMVCEGAILGVIGAVVAILISFIVAWAGQGLLEAYLEYRLGGEIAETVFQFSALSMLFVVLVSVFICVLASLIPAWRASRLDPIVAMRRT